MSCSELKVTLVGVDATISSVFRHLVSNNADNGHEDCSADSDIARMLMRSIERPSFAALPISGGHAALEFAWPNENRL
jgi:hypothetical protein